jgi:hypothetical protein
MINRTRFVATLVSLLVLTALTQNTISAQSPAIPNAFQKFVHANMSNLHAPFVSTRMFLNTAAGISDQSGGRAVTKATTITEPGSYVLLRDIVLEQSGTAILIAADNVSLDLNGYTISGPGNKEGVGIAVEAVSSISIHNGNIVDFGTGIRIANGHNVRVERVQIKGEDGGGPPPGEVGVLVLNSRAVVVKDNTISKTFLGIFVRGPLSGGNRIATNTLTGGQNGQIGICYNPDGSSNPAGPKGDLVYNNLISRFNIGIQTSAQTFGNIFRENDIAFFMQAIQEIMSGSNLFEENTSIAITP